MTKRAFLLTLAVLSAAPGAAAASTVDGRPVDDAAIEAETRSVSKAKAETIEENRGGVFMEHVRREWVRGELALAGIGVPDGVVAAAEQRERRAQGRAFASALRAEGWSEAVWREKVRGNVERRILFDSFFRAAPDDSSYERVFLDWAARWRSRTVCDRRYAGLPVCASARRQAEPCDAFGPVEICFFKASAAGPALWSIFEDVAGALGVDSNSEAEDRLAPRLEREQPALARHVEFDSEADFLGVSAKRRRPLVGVARFIHRLTLRRPTAPVLLPPE